jgi:hypothetical protein
MILYNANNNEKYERVQTILGLVNDVCRRNKR